MRRLGGPVWLSGLLADLLADIGHGLPYLDLELLHPAADLISSAAKEARP